MVDAGELIAELETTHGLLHAAAETGASRARRAPDPILRGRWLAVVAARVEHRERVASRLRALGVDVPDRGSRAGEASGEVGALLRADLGLSHAAAARAKRLSRLAVALGDAESGALLERVAAESLGHAAELARALALHYAREARAAAH